MNIAYVAPVVYPFVKGGAEKRIHEIGSRLADRGHEVTIYSRHWWDGPRVREHAGMTLRAIGPDHDIYGMGGRRSITNSVSFTLRALKTIPRSEDYDLYVTPAMPYLHVFASSFMSVVRRTPLVVTWHEAWGDHWYQYMGWSGAIGKGIEWLSGLLPQHVVAPSETTARRLNEFPFVNREVTVIPNGINIDRIRHVSPSDDGFAVLYAGRLIEDKNVQLLLDGFDQLDTDAHLGIVGDGPQSDVLRAHAASLSCRDRVSFLGFLDEYEDVVAHMHAADVFVSPSVREGFGITLLEAMAADCTVITVDHPNSAGSEVVEEAGFAVQPTADAIAARLDESLAGKRPAGDPVLAAREYSWGRVTDQTEAYYRRLRTGEDETGPSTSDQ